MARSFPGRSASRDLRLRLVLLVMCSLLPAVGLVLYTADQNRTTLADQVKADALRLATLTSVGNDAAIEGARQLLTSLARVPEVRSIESRACDRLLADLLLQFPGYANFGVDRPNGDIACSATPVSGTVNTADRLWFRRAVETKEFSVGEFQVGRITNKPTINFGYPILNPSGAVDAVVFAALDVTSLTEIAVKASLPPRSSVVVIDANGVIIARHPDPELWIGKAVPEGSLARAVRAHEQGTTEGRGVEGTNRLYGYTRLAGTDEITVAVGVPTSVAFADVNRALWRNLAGLALVGVLALVAAYVIGTAFVVRPVQHALAREREAVERLRQVDQMRSDFVSMVSHELRNPMATIRGFGQLLRDRPQTFREDQEREAYDVIVRQVDRMASLVDNVLDVSRLESDTFTYAFSPFDPRALLGECVAEASASWRKHDVSLKAARKLPSVTGDRDRLKQVFANLLSNACRYSPDGGRVAVSARVDDGGLTVEVADHGIGIAPEHIGALFQRFSRVRTPDTARIRGTGLGLYISKRIVEAHGGRISAASTPGEGSTFTVSIPLTRSE